MNKTSAWTWAATLSLMMTILPATAAGAGRGGWVAPLVALPLVRLGERLLCRPGGAGTANELRRLPKGGAGSVLTIIYMVWAAVLGGVVLRGGMRRVELTAPVGGQPWLLAVALVTLAVWFARGQVVFCARWAVPALGGLLAMLFGLAVLALAQVRWDNLLPLQWSWGGIADAAAVTAGVLCVRVYGGFVREEWDPPESMWRPVTVCGLVTLLLLEVQGALGVELAARLEDPLLTLSRNVGVEGTFQRVESLVAAGLLPAELALLTLLLWAARRSAERMWGARCGVMATLAVAAGVLVCALWPAEEAAVRWLRGRVVPGVNFVLGFATPLILAGIGHRKQGEKGAHLVAEDERKGTY